MRAIGQGGPVFAVSLESIDGYRVVTAGHMSGYSFVVQVADRVVRVWPVLKGNQEPPGAPPPAYGDTLLEADASALKSGVLIERAWNQAVVHEVTDDELAAGAAMVFVPTDRRTVVAELRFRRVEPNRASAGSASRKGQTALSQLYRGGSGPR